MLQHKARVGSCPLCFTPQQVSAMVSVTAQRVLGQWHITAGQHTEQCPQHSRCPFGFAAPRCPSGLQPRSGAGRHGAPAWSWQQQVAEPPMDAGPLPAHAAGAAATVSPGNVLGADDKEKKEHLPLCASHRLSCGCSGHAPKGVRILTVPQERQIPY